MDVAHTLLSGGGFSSGLPVFLQIRVISFRIKLTKDGLLDKITRLDLPKGTAINTYHIASDWHSFNMHKPSYNILVEHALDFPVSKRKLIINGDFLDIPYGMKKNEQFKFWKSKAHNVEEFFLPAFNEEVAWGNAILDELQMVFSEIIFIAAYKDHFILNNALNLHKRGIISIPYNHWLDIGKLSVTHGMAHGTTAIKKHYEKSGGRSVCFGHVHQVEIKSFHSRGETKQGFSLPAMCDLNPEYMRDTENNWSNGFAVVNMKSNGSFNYHIMQVWDDELVLPRGRVLRG